MAAVRPPERKEAPNVAAARARSRRGVRIAFVFLVPAVILVLLSGDDDEGPVAMVGGALLLGALACFAYAAWIRYRLRRGEVDDPIAATGGEDGHRVLYLRPFGQDDDWGVYLPFTPWNPLTWRLLLRPMGLVRCYLLFFTGRMTWEQVLKAACRPVGRVVAIGEPGERLPTLGLLNTYVDDEGWQGEVEELIDRSQLVVVRAGVSDGVLWEFEHVVPRVRPERLVIYVGQRSLDRRDAGTQARQEFYEEFRSEVSEFFPAGLPKDLGKKRFIRFEADGTAVVHSRRVGDRSPNVRVANYMESVLL